MWSLCLAESVLVDVKFIGIYSVLQGCQKMTYRDDIEVRSAVDSSVWSKINRSEQKGIEKSPLKHLKKEWKNASGK